MRIENWSLLNVYPYTAPECQQPSLNGDVFGHPDISDGMNITTSSVKKVENGIAETYSGSFYELGVVNPEYEAQFPNALERLNAKENP